MDGFLEDDLDLWDTAAGVILVKEAGGFVTDYRGSDRSFEPYPTPAAPVAFGGRRGYSFDSDGHLFPW